MSENIIVLDGEVWLNEAWTEQTLRAHYDIEPFQPGNICGPPEACYPDEGGFADIVEWEILLSTPPIRGKQPPPLWVTIPECLILFGTVEEARERAWDKYCAENPDA